MDKEDQNKIIKKVKTSGKGGEESSDSDSEDTSDETQDTGADDTSDETQDTGSDDTVNTGSTDTEDDSENMFETEMLDEMSLNDEKTILLIDMYDNGDEKIKHILTRLVSYSNKINKDEFISDLRMDTGNSDVLRIFIKLDDLGIDVPDYLRRSAYTPNQLISLDIEPEAEYSDINEGDFLLKNPKKNNMFQEGSNDILDEKDDRCTRIAKRKYDVWPSAYASGAVVRCRKGEIWKGVDENYLSELDKLEEKWSEKYKKSIDCNNPKGFSQKAHCQGKKKHG